MPGPLHGIRVIDQTVWQLGPMCGSMLGDLGAEVIKIEERVGGDPGRGITHILDYVDVQLPSGRNWYFECCNRNKKSVTLNLKTQKGQEIAHKLIEGADVYLQNMRKGVVDRLGMGYDVLSKINPRLIYASGSGFGPEGPDSHRPAFDYSGQARSGFMYMFGEPGSPPIAGSGGIGDQIGAIILAYGILAALFAREKTGRGQNINVSHLSASMWLMGLSVGSELFFHKPWPRYSRTKTGNPMWNHYQCKDGKWLALTMLQSQRYWPTLCNDIISRPDLVDNPQFSTIEARRSNGAELAKILDDVFAQKTRDEWAQTIKDSGKDLVYESVQDLEDLADDEQVKANNYIVDFDHPALGKIKMLNCPVIFSETPAAIQKEAPMFGENTEEVLLDAGYNWDDIVKFKEEEVI